LGGYHWSLRRAMLASEIEALREYKPRWLRASFASAVLSAGANSDCVQKYMGHAPTSVLTRHYAQISDEMLRAAILPAITKWWHKSGILTDPSSQIQSNHGFA
jgi:site-specific recombinase XerD